MEYKWTLLREEFNNNIVKLWTQNAMRSKLHDFLIEAKA